MRRWPLRRVPASSIPPDLDNLLLESNLPPRFKMTDRGLALEVGWDVAGMTLTSLTGYRDYENSFLKDNDFTGVDMLTSPQNLPEVRL